MSKKIELTRSELLDLVWSRPVSVLADEFGLSPNGLAKICDRLEIERPPKGYWRSKGEAGRAEKPASIADPDGVVTIGGDAAGDRRRRTRLSGEERRRMMLDCARDIAHTSGTHQISLKAIAKQLGMSEAQAHNILSTREDLLVDLAFEEVVAFEMSRRASVQRGGTRIAKVVLSSINYLREVSRRGPLLQRLVRDSGVRDRIDKLRDEIRAPASERHIRSVVREKNVDTEEAIASVSIMTALLVRAGGLVSEDNLKLEQAERLCLPILISSAIEGAGGEPASTSSA